MCPHPGDKHEKDDKKEDKKGRKKPKKPKHAKHCGDMYLCGGECEDQDED